MKKIYTFIFMALCLFSANKAMADLREGVFSEPNNDGKVIFYYQIPETNTVEVTFDGAVLSWDTTKRTYYSGDLVIPSVVTHDGVDYTVIGIGDLAFAVSDFDRTDNELLTSITLPNTCEYIGHTRTICFARQTKLKEIVIPDKVTFIDNAAFRYCYGLESITIGAGITDLTSNDGIFNLALEEGNGVQSKVRKVTVRATEPPKVNWKTFLGVDMPNIFLLVPPESLDAYKNHTEDYGEASEWFTGWSFFGNIYPIGAPLHPLYFEATMSGLLTWWGDAPAYELIISTTELDKTALAAYTAGDIRTTETEYGAELDAEEGINYAYVRSDYGDGNTSTWESVSFYFYVRDFCEYTVSGEDLYYLVKPDDDYEEPLAWSGTGLEIWQAGFLMTTVAGDAAFYGATVSLIPGIPATLKWIGDSKWGDQCTLTFEDAAGNKIIEEDDLLDSESKTWDLSIDNNCNATLATGVKKLNVSDASITPTLSKGFVTVTAAAGSVAKVTDLTGRTLKLETITGASQKVELNYANGVYLILLEKGNSRFVQKVILRR
jgi:hypothetical protein